MQKRTQKAKLCFPSEEVSKSRNTNPSFRFLIFWPEEGGGVREWGVSKNVFRGQQIEAARPFLSLQKSVSKEKKQRQKFVNKRQKGKKLLRKGKNLNAKRKKQKKRQRWRTSDKNLPPNLAKINFFVLKPFRGRPSASREA